MEDLPLNGRQFVQLLQLAPGTVPVSVSQTAVPQVGSAGSNVTPSINGGSGRSNLFFVDGLYATDPFFTSLSISPSVDAIREFQEQTHTDEAQFGGSIGATVNLATKGGQTSFTVAPMTSSATRRSRQHPTLPASRAAIGRISLAAR